MSVKQFPVNYRAGTQPALLAFKNFPATENAVWCSGNECNVSDDFSGAIS